MKITFENIFLFGGKNEKQILVWGGVLATLFLATLICFASCDNGSTSGGGTQNSQSSINYSLGDPPDESKRTSDFKVEQNPDGIYLTFVIPENTGAVRVRIDGIGQVAEEVYKESKDKGSFFYPFLDPNKTYKIRIVFEEDEIQDGDGYFVISSGDVINWFETEVTAGAKSKGEVRLKYKGDIEVKNTGDFRFTKKPEFYGESVFTNYDWKENIGLVEGISWEHGDARKTKWRAQFPIPNAELTKWCNLYADAGTKGWKDNDLIKIDFLCIRPCLEYNYNGKPYNYQWENFLYETPYLSDETLLWTTIDINNPTDVAKIQGTWKISDYWEENFNVDENHRIPLKCECTEIVTINAQNLQDEFVEIYTKIDGSAFTEEEKGYWENYIYKELRDTIEVSNYKVIGKITENTTLSEYFEDSKLKLSKDGSELQSSEWSNKEEEYYTYIYKKQ